MSSMLYPSAIVRMAGVAWVVAWAAMAAALVPGLLALGGAPTPPLPSIDPPAAAGVGNFAGSASARVVSVDMGAAETTIAVLVEGPNVAGYRLVFRGPAFLVDANGKAHIERGGSIAGLLLTLRFDGAGTIPEGAAELRLSGVGLTLDKTIDPAPAQVTYMPDATLAVAVGGTYGAVRTVPGAERSEALAHGAVSLDAVLIDDSAIVVRGRLTGFSREELQAISLGRSVMIMDDGRQVALTGGRSGFGQDLQQFELHFRPGHPAAVAVGVRLQLDVNALPEQVTTSSAATAARLAELESSSGATATLAINSQ